MKGTILILIALFIDALQAGVSIGLAAAGSALFALTPVGAGLAGAGAGCAAGTGLIGCIKGAVVGGIAAAAASPIGVPLGIAMGFAVNLCISATFGAGLVILLIMNGMFYPKYLAGNGIAELLPGINDLPGWTLMVILCLIKKKAEEGGSAMAGATAATAILAPGSLIGISVGGARTSARISRRERAVEPSPQGELSQRGEKTSQRVSGELKNVDGIGPNRAAIPRQAAAALAILIFFSAGASVHAQSFTGQPAPVQYTVSPETPGPNQSVTIQVQGIGSFLGDATVTWQQNGKTVQSAPGLETFSFTTGAVGSVANIHLIINSPTQGTITHDFSFSPSLTNLIWEADTSVPAFYVGKPLYSAGSDITVVAFPIVASGGALVSTSRLSFQWSRNDTLVPDSSGLGQNVITFIGDGIKSSENITVDIFLGSTKVGHSEISIPANSPQIILYDKDPLRGELLDSALPASIALNGKELTVQAEPYFFSNRSVRRNALTFTWTLNGNETTGPDSAQGSLTLRQTGAGAGAAVLGVSVQNGDTDKLMQSASASLQITFGQTTGSSLSSFLGL